METCDTHCIISKIIYLGIKYCFKHKITVLCQVIACDSANKHVFNSPCARCLPISALVSDLTRRLFQIAGVSGRCRTGTQLRWTVRYESTTMRMGSRLTGSGDTPNCGHDRQLLLGSGATRRPIPETSHQKTIVFPNITPLLGYLMIFILIFTASIRN